MKSNHLNIAKNRTTKQRCVKYHPTSAGEPRPSIDALLHALSAYNRVAIGERTVFVEAAFGALEKAALAAKARYPHLGLTILEDGQDIFATHQRLSTEPDHMVSNAVQGDPSLKCPPRYGIDFGRSGGGPFQITNRWAR